MLTHITGIISNLTFIWKSFSVCIISRVFFSVLKIELNQMCNSRDGPDQCKDEFAECHVSQRRCLCRDGYYEDNRKCCKFQFIVIL